MKHASTFFVLAVTFRHWDVTQAASADHRQHALRGQGKYQNKNRMIRGHRTLKVDDIKKGKGKGSSDEPVEPVVPPNPCDPVNPVEPEIPGKSGKGKSGNGKSGRTIRRLKADVELVTNEDAHPQQERLTMVVENGEIMCSEVETAKPTVSSAPSGTPSDTPTLSSGPSEYPSSSPSISSRPSELPSVTPSSSVRPSSVPSKSPNSSPSISPSSGPSLLSSSTPTLSSGPSEYPSSSPSTSSRPSELPSVTPSVSVQPSSGPSSVPSLLSSSTPTLSSGPSEYPSSSPSTSSRPSELPSVTPSLSVQPSFVPSKSPSSIPSKSPSSIPSGLPSSSPSTSSKPSGLPSSSPSTSTKPSTTPSLSPSTSQMPSRTPSQMPSTCTDNDNRIWCFANVNNTWREHENTAVGLCGHLVSIDTSEKNEIIRKLDEISVDENLRFWIGLECDLGRNCILADAGNWAWTDDSSYNYPDPFTNWKDGEPNNEQHDPDEHCAEMLMSGEWNDQNCMDESTAVYDLPYSSHCAAVASGNTKCYLAASCEKEDNCPELPSTDCS